VSSRRLIALLAALALALFVVACGGDSGGGSSSDGKSATQLLQAASKKPAKSADVKVSFEAEVKGSEDVKGPIKLDLEGPYKSNGKGALPDLDWKVKAEGDGKSFEARLITTKDNAWVEYQGTTYEVGTQLVSKFTQSMKQGQSTQQQEELKRLGLNPSNIIKNAKVEDGEAGGVETHHISGDIDVRKFLESLNKLFQSPAFSNQLPPGAAKPSLSPQTISEIEQAVKEAHVETDVGKDDGILRKSGMDMSFEVPSDKRSQVDNVEGGSFKFSVEQSDVNGDQSVTPPTGARPITELLQKIGIPPQLLQGPGFTTPSPG
jgi:hypothetical protein